MLRSAGDEDVATMLAWRNQEANREVSVQRHVISTDEHERWWRARRDDPSGEVLVLEIDGVPCGVVTFDDLDLHGDVRTGSWGFYLDHDGLAASGLALLVWQRVMREALDHAFDDLRLDVLTAEVLAGNEAVRSANRRHRFREGTPHDVEADGRTVTVIPLELRREDRRPSRTVPTVVSS